MSDYRQRLEEAALECAEEDQKGWGNLMLDAATEIDQLRAFFDAAQHNLNWQNNNDIVADYADQCPDECAALEAALEVFTKRPEIE